LPKLEFARLSTASTLVESADVGDAEQIGDKLLTDLIARSPRTGIEASCADKGRKHHDPDADHQTKNSSPDALWLLI
jgi:hypothetical protein